MGSSLFGLGSLASKPWGLTSASDTVLQAHVPLLLSAFYHGHWGFELGRLASKPQGSACFCYTSHFIATRLPESKEVTCLL